MDNQKSTDEIFVPEEKKVTIAGREFSIRPFVLKNRVIVVRILVDAIKQITGKRPNEQVDIEKNPMSMISLFINLAGEKLAELYPIVLGVPIEWLNERMQIKDEIAVMKAIMELNDLPFLLDQVKVMAKSLNVKMPKIQATLSTKPSDSSQENAAV